MNIYLTGYRCTGKTSIGRSLAESLKIPFVDADIYLSDKYNMTISNIVSKQGWESFREKESIVLKEISKQGNRVIATGGGVILKEKNITLMKKKGIVIWLQATPDTIKKRIIQDESTKDSRPSLTPKGLLNEIEETLNQRRPLYKKSMNFTVNTDNVEIDRLCSRIMKTIKQLKN